MITFHHQILISVTTTTKFNYVSVSQTKDFKVYYLVNIIIKININNNGVSSISIPPPPPPPPPRQQQKQQQDISSSSSIVNSNDHATHNNNNEDNTIINNNYYKLDVKYCLLRHGII